MTDYLKEFNTISKSQHEFSAKISTQTSGLHFGNCYYCALDGGLDVHVFFSILQEYLTVFHLISSSVNYIIWVSEKFIWIEFLVSTN